VLDTRFYPQVEKDWNISFPIWRFGVYGILANIPNFRYPQIEVVLPKEPKTYKNVGRNQKTWFSCKVMTKTFFFTQNNVYPMDYIIEPPFMSYNIISYHIIHVIEFSFVCYHHRISCS